MNFRVKNDLSESTLKVINAGVEMKKEMYGELFPEQAAICGLDESVAFMGFKTFEEEQENSSVWTDIFVGYCVSIIETYTIKKADKDTNFRNDEASLKNRITEMNEFEGKAKFDWYLNMVISFAVYDLLTDISTEEELYNKYLAWEASYETASDY